MPGLIRSPERSRRVFPSTPDTRACCFRARLQIAAQASTWCNGTEGVQGPADPQGEPGATSVVRRVSSQVIVAPGGINTATVECLDGEQVTGGGHIVNDNTPELLPIVLASDVSTAGNGWIATIYSLAVEPDAMEIPSVAMCASP